MRGQAAAVTSAFPDVGQGDLGRSELANQVGGRSDEAVFGFGTPDLGGTWSRHRLLPATYRCSTNLLTNKLRYYGVPRQDELAALRPFVPAVITDD
jgi:hypothetical protein